MESTPSSNKTRKYNNTSILSEVDFNKIESDIYKETVMTENLKLNGGSDYVNRNYVIKGLMLPNANYPLIKEHLIKGYKLLKYSSNYEKVKRVFLIGYSHLAIRQCFYLSAYSSYETNDPNKVFEIDNNIYNELLNHESLKKYVEKFEINSYNSTTFVEEGSSIREKEEEIFESPEDSEFTFDVHLPFINILFSTKKVKIVPIWINSIQAPNPKEIYAQLGDYLGGYLAKEENIIICSTNLTYFGRIYNYFGDNNKFKPKMFLRDPKNEKEVLEFIKGLDDKGLKALKAKKVDSVLKLTNFNYCKELFSTFLLALRKFSEVQDEQLAYYIQRVENLDENDYELNLVSFVSLIYFVLLNKN
jgi:AmmeMemoRadiSam system protein B